MHRRTARNSLALLASQAATALVTALMLPLLTRYLGAVGYGLYNSVYAFVGVFGILGDVGLNITMNREIARQREQSSRILGQTLVLKSLLGLLFLAVVMVAAIPRSFGPLKWLLLSTCALESGVRTFANTVIAAFRAHEVMGYETVITLLDRACWVVGIVLVVWLDLGLVAAFFVFLFAAVVRLFSAFAIGLMRIPHPRPGIDLKLWRLLLKEAWPIGLALGTGRAYDRLGVVQLSAVTDSGVVGLFSGPHRVYQLTNALTLSVPEALFPSMSAAAGVSLERLRRICANGLTVLMLTTLPLAGFYAMFAPHLIPWLLGVEFRDAAFTLQILAPAVVLAAVNALLNALLRASGRQRYGLLCLLGALVTNFGLNLLLTPSLEHVGAAIATLASQGLLTVLAGAGSLFVLKRLPARILFVSLLATLSMIGVWWLMDPLPLVVSLPTGLVVYAGILFLLGGIERSTVRLFSSLLSSRVTLGQGKEQGDAQ